MNTYVVADLKECPFCKNKRGNKIKKLVINAQFDVVEHRVECNKCGALGGKAFTPEKAISLWNTRE